MPVLTVSSRTGAGIDASLPPADSETIALLGASGVGKSTLVNRLVGEERQQTGDVREGDQRGRHVTIAAELVRIPGGGWLIDTPGLRAVSLWASGQGIERTFRDVFDLMDDCRFRDCKHEGEPGCAVQAAIAAGTARPGPAPQPEAAGRGRGEARGGAAREGEGLRPARCPETTQALSRARSAVAFGDGRRRGPCRGGRRRVDGDGSIESCERQPVAQPPAAAHDHEIAAVVAGAPGGAQHDAEPDVVHRLDPVEIDGDDRSPVIVDEVGQGLMYRRDGRQVDVAGEGQHREPTDRFERRS